MPLDDLLSEHKEKDIPLDRAIVFKVMAPLQGHAKMMWDADDPDDVEDARRSFDTLRDRGFTAFKLDKNGVKGSRMDRFDPKAGAFIMIPARAGG